jgi:hypothetical protein
MATSKKPSAAQIRARKLFAERVKAGAFKRRASSAKKAAPAKKRTVKAAPSPAQLRARKKFVAMVRARAAAKKKPNSPHRPERRIGAIRKNTVVCRGRKAIKVNSRGFSTRPPSWVSSKTLVRKKRTKRSRNPLGGHLPGLPEKYQRMYEHILASSGSKRIAAATVHKELSRQNPSLFSRLFGKAEAKVGYRKTQRGRSTKLAKVGYRKTQRGTHRPTSYMEMRSLKHNPKVDSVFSEFRGKDVSRASKLSAATGTPSTLAELGRLKGLKLRGRTLRFNSGRLAADSRKKLHVVGVKMKYRGNPNGSEIDVGEILSVTYQADKPHIEKGVFKYVHKFGEEGGVRPHLIIDAEGYPKIEGGSYGITSDGIID